MLALSALFWWMHRRRALLEERFDPKAPLRDGVTVIFGRVETEQGNTPVAIGIQQVAREWQYKGAWNHAWEEVGRVVRATPFVLRTPDGTAVRVEPPQTVALHGDFSRIERHSHTQRTCVLDLTNGRDVHVYGVLQGAQLAHASGAYRQGGAMPVLSGSTMAPMVISTEKPGAMPRARAKVHRNMGIALAAWMVFALVVVFQQFVWLSLDGEVVPVRVEATREWREWVKPKNSAGYWRYHYELRGSARGTVVADEVGFSLYRAVRSGEVQSVPFVVSSLRPTVNQFGSSPRTTVGRLIVGILAAIIFGITYPLVAMGSRPWYLKKKYKVGGAGTISDGDVRAAKAAPKA
jgi:hypothetical protein